MPENKQKAEHFRRVKKQSQPFWQADKPYLHEHHISDARFRLLGYVMAFLAGAINAGGFFAVARYTSHVTGEMSFAADMMYTREWQAVAVAMLGVVSFIMGAAHSSWVILWTQRQRFRGSFGLSMWLEGLYLLFFGFLGLTEVEWSGGAWPSIAMLLLCFIMGMHNTVMTILSGGVIRSTHMTGTATDLGIEISKVLYYSRGDNPKIPNVNVNKPKMKLLCGLMAAFVTGGLVGAWGYHTAGHHFALPVSLVLFILGFGSVGYDVRLRIKWWVIARLKSGKD